MSLPKISSARFATHNSADVNRLFLYEAKSGPPFVGPVAGWKIVGYGRAPWKKGDSDFAVMFEKVCPADPDRCSTRGEECAEGTQIWMHYQKDWVNDPSCCPN